MVIYRMYVDSWRYQKHVLAEEINFSNQFHQLTYENHIECSIHSFLRSLSREKGSFCLQFLIAEPLKHPE